MSWIQEIIANPFVQALLAFLGVAGPAWGLFTRWSDNRKMRFSTAYSSFEIVKQGKTAIPDLSLSFSGKEIHNLSISKFAIWNSGNKVIRSTDIVPSQKLRIVADCDSEILDAQIITESEESNCFAIGNTSNNQVCLDFDYVTSREGVVIQVLHTGDMNSLKVDGKIKGGDPIRRLGTETKRRRTSPKKEQGARKVSAVIMFIEAVFLAVMTIILTLVNMDILPEKVLISLDKAIIASSGTTIYLIIMWAIMSIALIAAFRILRNAFMVGVPSKLKSYANSFER